MSLNLAKSCLAAAALLTGVLATAQTQVVATSELSVRPLHVASVLPAGVADLVLLDGGYSAGWRQGMSATVHRDGSTVAQVRFAELRRDASIALITSLEPGSVIQTGDRVTVNAILSYN